MVQSRLWLALKVRHNEKGPRKVTFVAEAVIERFPGESDQDYKCRIVKERYMLVNGETHEEKGDGTFL